MVLELGTTKTCVIHHELVESHIQRHAFWVSIHLLSIANLLRKHKLPEAEREWHINCYSTGMRLSGVQRKRKDRWNLKCVIGSIQQMGNGG